MTFQVQSLRRDFSPVLTYLFALSPLFFGSAIAQPVPASMWSFDEAMGSTALDTGVSAIGPALHMNFAGDITRSSDTPVSARGHVFGGKSIRFGSASLPYLWANPFSNTKLESQTLTVEAWIKLSQAGAQTVFSYLPPGAGNDGRGFSLSVSSAGRIGMAVGRGIGLYDSLNAPAGTEISLNSWHHVAGSFEPGRTRLFVDGFEVAEKITTGPVVYADRSGFGPNPKTAYIGIYHNANNTGSTNASDLQFGMLPGAQLDRVRVHREAFRGSAGVGTAAESLDFWTCGQQQVSVEPAAMNACASGIAVFSAVATGNISFAYQWQTADPTLGWIDLADGPLTVDGSPTCATVTGSHDPTLIVSLACTEGRGDLDGRWFRCVVSNACGSALSNPATLTICACLACPADFNQDGGIDGSDVSAFFDRWEVGHCDADVNADGGVDGGDVDNFFAAWEAGGC
ncbi:MAG: LamG domain-containing protein [Planctomycetes bacterium]|nr:LamG domain-containing protein [Planctomycetota bacterium]